MAKKWTFLFMALKSPSVSYVLYLRLYLLYRWHLFYRLSYFYSIWPALRTNFILMYICTKQKYVPRGPPQGVGSGCWGSTLGPSPPQGQTPRGRSKFYLDQTIIWILANFSNYISHSPLPHLIPGFNPGVNPRVDPEVNLGACMEASFWYINIYILI